MKTALEIAVDNLLEISAYSPHCDEDSEIVDIARTALIEMTESANGEIVRAYIASSQLNKLKL